MALAIRSNSKISYPIPSVGTFTATLAVRETSPAHSPKPRLLDRVRLAIRARHYSRRTEKAYVGWIRRYIFFHGKRHPAEMGAPEVTAFLTSLAVHGKVGASTQNQALSALLFLYRDVLGVELPWLDDIVRAKRPAAPARRARPATRCAPSSSGSTACHGSWRCCCTAPACACSSAAACASRTSTSRRTRSSSATARATRTA